MRDCRQHPWLPARSGPHVARSQIQLLVGREGLIRPESRWSGGDTDDDSSRQWRYDGDEWVVSVNDIYSAGGRSCL